MCGSILTTAHTEVIVFVQSKPRKDRYWKMNDRINDSVNAKANVFLLVLWSWAFRKESNIALTLLTISPDCDPNYDRHEAGNRSPDG